MEDDFMGPEVLSTLWNGTQPGVLRKNRIGVCYLYLTTSGKKLWGHRFWVMNGFTMWATRFPVQSHGLSCSNIIKYSAPRPL